MRIENISVRGLFDRFDHDIPLDPCERIAIIYGPNGFGKTMILRMVNALFNSPILGLGRMPFREICVDFDDGSRLDVVRDSDASLPEITLTSAAQEVKLHKPLSELPPWLEEIRATLPIRFIDTAGLRDFSGYGKLAVFDDIYARFDAFMRIANERLLYKRISVGLDGLNVTNSEGSNLDLETLSSGEQHQIALLFELLFETEPNSLILIDEPELSLHVAWQREMLKDLQEIAELSDFRVILATHSPQIINDRWDLTIGLKGPDQQ